MKKDRIFSVLLALSQMGTVTGWGVEYRVRGGTGLERYELAEDEVLVSRAGSFGRDALNLERQARGGGALVRDMVGHSVMRLREPLDGARAARGEEGARGAGVEIQPVLYPKGLQGRPEFGVYGTREVMVRLKPGQSGQDLVVLSGAEGVRPASVAGWVYLKFENPWRALEAANLLQARGEQAEPVVQRVLQKYAAPDDDQFSNQWHLRNTGQGGGAPGIDANVVSAWDVSKGAGVNLVVVDDSVQVGHPDLRTYSVAQTPSVDSPQHRNFLGGVLGLNNPTPQTPDESHGTSVAGVALARQNNQLDVPSAQGVSGSGPEANLLGIRIIGGPAADEDFATALTWNPAGYPASVSNNSWGFGGAPGLRSSGPIMEAALAKAAQEGRTLDLAVTNTAGTAVLSGLVSTADLSVGMPVLGTGVQPGSRVASIDSSSQVTLTQLTLGAVSAAKFVRGQVTVFANGNSRTRQDNGNYQQMQRNRFVVAVGAIDNSGVQSWYSNPGANLLISAPSNGGSLGIFTTDNFNLAAAPGYNPGTGEPTGLGYTNSFGGTSSATPLVSGGVAVILGANPRLGWRDVCEILAQSAVKVDGTDSDWATNGAGFHFNHRYGAGMIDVTTAATLALDWRNLGAETSLTMSSAAVLAVPDNNAAGVSRMLDFSGNPNMRVERVTVKALITHTRRSDLQLELVSPSGTRSILAETHAAPPLSFGDSNIDYREGADGWTFSTTHHWGENSAGIWTVVVKDLAAGTTGDWQLCDVTLFGTSAPAITQRVGFASRRSQVLEGAGSTASIVVNRLGGSAGSANVTCVLGGFNGAAQQTNIPAVNAAETAVITLPATTGLVPGMLVRGVGVRPGSRITAVDSGTNQITLDRPTSAAAVSITVNPHSGDSALEGVDFTSVYSQTVSFADGETSKTITVPIPDNATEQESRFFYLILKDATGNAALGGNVIHRVEILDDDSNRVTIRVGDSALAESDGVPNPGSFIVSRVVATSAPLTVNLSAPTGTAASGFDYEALPTSVTIPAGASSVEVPVNVLEDLLVEGTETINLTVAAGPGSYALGTPSSATLNLRDNDLPSISVESTGGSPVIEEAKGISGITNTAGTTALLLSSAPAQFNITDLAVGMSVAGTGIAPGTTVASISVSELTVTLSAATLQSVTAARFYRPGKFTIKRERRNGATLEESVLPIPTVVQLDVGGSAESGTHYDPIASTVTIPGLALAQVGTVVNTTNVTCAGGTTGLQVGMKVSGLGIAAGTVVTAVGPTAFSINPAANDTVGSVTLSACISEDEFTFACADTTGLRTGMVVAGTGLAAGTQVVQIIDDTRFILSQRPAVLPEAPGVEWTASVTLTAGLSSVDLLVAQKDDALYNGTLSVVATVMENAAYAVTAQKGSATVSITDNDRLPDRRKPSVTIATPKAGLRVTQSQVAVGISASGSASDNVRDLSAVVYRVNSAAPHVIPVGSLIPRGSVSDWTATLSPAEIVPGLNTLRVYSEDKDGNQSPVVVRTFLFTKTNLLTVNLLVNGAPATPTSGVSVDRGYLPPAHRDANTTYRITASSSSRSGLVFSGWTGLVNSNSRTLSFVMPDTPATLTANFVTSPYATEITGNYAGLVQKAAGFAFNSTGFLSATVTAGGVCSGRLTLGRVVYPNTTVTAPLVGTVSYPFKGEFVPGVPAAGQATLNVLIPRKDARDNLTLNLVLDLNPAGTRRITGTVTGTDAGPGFGTTPVSGVVSADRAHYSKILPYAAPTKPFTFIVPPRSITTTSLATRSGNVITLTGVDTATTLGIRENAYVSGTNILPGTTVTAASADGLQLTVSQAPTGNPTADLAFANPTEPTGHGYGTATVDTLGRVFLTGKLADGSRFVRLGAVLSKDNTWPLYLPLYAGRSGAQGVFFGTSVVQSASDSDMKTTGTWYKSTTGSDANLLPSGFGPFPQTLLAALYTAPSATGSPWVIPGQATADPAGSVLLNFTKGSLLNTEFSTQVNLSSLKNSTVFVGDVSATPALVNPKKVTFGVSAATGLFSGRFVHPRWPATVGYEGVIYQKTILGTPRGYGAFLAPRAPLGQTGFREIGNVILDPNAP